MQTNASKSTPKERNKAFGAAVFVLVAACGLGSRKYALYLPEWVAAYTGDTAWTVAVFLVLGIVLPWISTRTAAALALAISFIVEFSQLYHAPWIDAILRNDNRSSGSGLGLCSPGPGMLYRGCRHRRAVRPIEHQTQSSRGRCTVKGSTMPSAVAAAIVACALAPIAVSRAEAALSGDPAQQGDAARFPVTIKVDTSKSMGEMRPVCASSATTSRTIPT